MGQSFTIPLRTLAANAVIDDSTVPLLKQSVTTESQFDLIVARNVGTASLDSLPATHTVLTLTFEWSVDGTTWHAAMSASTPGGAVFADKAQTIRLETFEIHWPFRANFPNVQFIRGRVNVGPDTVTISGSGDLI